MSHILVKWATSEEWDVYPTRSMADVATATSIMKDTKVVETLTGKTFKILWKDNEAPCDAYLVAAGEADKMERKRTKLAAQAKRSPSSAINACCEHVSQVEELKKENAALKMSLDAQKDLVDTSKILKKLQRLVNKLEASAPATPAQAQENMHQNIGGGVLVSRATLTRLEENFRDAPSKFARALLRVLFTDAELENKTLFGRQANSHKDQPAKAGLDQKRVAAVLVLHS
ncbi:uncharacterized protein LOC119387547 isoform X2 [Rhipicephalus sanguineus]|uniref:uncharacterized protein LOC119387547 isoform X2 n=1 Tax=Rhipicephalus sanguineus TaxID=34632 RepID=UPI001895F34C|nr:uncharacterized protein LOC119387547 isoform X2 [Rhipicephalus sanguineus]